MKLILCLCGVLLLCGCTKREVKQLEYDMLIAADDECHAQLDEMEQDKNIVPHRNNKETNVKKVSTTYPDTPVARVQHT